MSRLGLFAGLSEQALADAERQAKAAGAGGNALHALYNEVVEALDRGGAVRGA